MTGVTQAVKAWAAVALLALAGVVSCALLAQDIGGTVDNPEQPTTDASELITGTLLDGRVAESNVTQHEGALSIAGGQVDSGTLPDARLSSNVPLENENNTFTERQTISSIDGVGVIDFEGSVIIRPETLEDDFRLRDADNNDLLTIDGETGQVSVQNSLDVGGTEVATYESGSIALTLDTGCSNPAASYEWRYTRVGNQVTITPEFYGFQCSSDSVALSFSTSMPVDLRPSGDSVWIETRGLSGNANRVNACIEITTAGVVRAFVENGSNMLCDGEWNSSGSKGVAWTTFSYSLEET